VSEETAQSGSPPAPPVLSARKTMFVVAAMSLAQGMVFYDISAIGIALPEIRNSLGLQASYLPWVVNAYIVSYAACVAIAGKLGDTIGTRTTFRLGVWLFLIGSALAGATPRLDQISGGWILCARVVQGIGGALVMPTTLAIVLELIPPERRGRIVSYVVSGAQAIFLLGPLLGGILSQHASWRAVFYIALPAGLLALSIVSDIPWSEDRSEERKADLSGYLVLSTLLASGLSLFVFGLQVAGGSSTAWTLPLITMISGIVLLAAFVRLNQRAPKKLLPLKLFRSLNYVHFSFAVVSTQMFAVAVCVFVPQTLQTEFQLTPSAAGFVLLAFVGGWIAIVPVTGRLFDKFGPYQLLLAGPLITLAGFGAFNFASEHSSLEIVVPWLFVSGLGTGLTVLPSYVSAVSVGSEEERGSVVGLTQTARQVAGSISIAVLSGAFVLSVPGSPKGYAAVEDGYRLLLLLLSISAVVNVLFWLRHRHLDSNQASKSNDTEEP
jgi:MFS family permease